MIIPTSPPATTMAPTILLNQMEPTTIVENPQGTMQTTTDSPTIMDVIIAQYPDMPAIDVKILSILFMLARIYIWIKFTGLICYVIHFLFSPRNNRNTTALQGKTLTGEV